ncbi:uncharacterized protein [Palaemon carinicauda]|uniref:uncharacterized protein n=1 Tax=Palaemon carinicauda TaxID=392227 RepID=UPI0035B5E4FB
MKYILHIPPSGECPLDNSNATLRCNVSTGRTRLHSHGNCNIDSCTSALLSRWIARFGIPEHITSDRGTTFTSQLWTSLANLLGITLHQKTAYNPAANGMVELFHRTLKPALMSHCKDSNWFSPLYLVFLGLRTTSKDALFVSAAEMVYGNPLVIPVELYSSATSSDNLQRLRHIVGKFTPCRQTYNPPAKHCILTDLH